MGFDKRGGENWGGGKGGDVDCGGRRGGFLLLVVWNFECTDGVVVGFVGRWDD